MISSTTPVSPRLDPLPLTPWHFLVLLGFPWIVYGRSLSFGFVMHEDDRLVRDNPLWGKAHSWQTAFLTDTSGGIGQIGSYRPWQSLTFMLDHALAGVQPYLYHLHNLVVFSAGLSVLFLFLKQHVSPRVAWGAAMLFGVNLLMPHSVGWIAARGDLYLFLFGLLYLLCVIRYVRTGASLWLVGSVPVFVLALLAKEIALCLLPVAAILLWPSRAGRGIHRPMLAYGMALTLIIFAYLVLRARAVTDTGSFSALHFLSNSRSFPEELLRMIVPVGFSVMPGYHGLRTLAGIGLLGAFVLFMRRNKPSPEVARTGLGLWILPLVPMMAYVPEAAGVACDNFDHRTLLPLAGLALLGAATIDKIGADTPAVRRIFICLLFFWAGINTWRIGAYENAQAYYENAIATNPHSGRAVMNYIEHLRDSGKLEEALLYAQQAVALSADDARAHILLAEIYLQLGRYAECATAATSALSLAPDNLRALQFRGSALGAGGRAAESIADFRRILALDPYNASAIFNLGLAYKETRQYAEAAGMFTQLMGINPKFPNAMFERGFCYSRMGLFKQANEDLSMSILFQPEHGPSYLLRGRVWEALGDGEKACLDWREAYRRGIKEAEAFIATRCKG